MKNKRYREAADLLNSGIVLCHKKNNKMFLYELYESLSKCYELENNYIDLNISDVKFQGEIKWKPLKGLEFGALTAVRYQKSDQEHYVKAKSNQALFLYFYIIQLIIFLGG